MKKLVLLILKTILLSRILVFKHLNLKMINIYMNIIMIMDHLLKTKQDQPKKQLLQKKLKHYQRDPQKQKKLAKSNHKLYKYQRINL